MIAMDYNTSNYRRIHESMLIQINKLRKKGQLLPTLECKLEYIRNDEVRK